MKELKQIGISQLFFHINELNEEMVRWDSYQRTVADFGKINIYAFVSVNGKVGMILLVFDNNNALK